jgi:AraC-like DNA-binding protein
MLRYIMQAGQVQRILHLLTSVTDVRIVLFDMDDRKLREFDVRPDSAYCSRLRRKPSFDRACAECDRTHIQQARTRTQRVVYRCHHNLIEAVVPLFDQDGNYLGGIMFGQIRVAGATPPHPEGSALRRYYDALPAHNDQRVRDIADLLTYVAQYMIQNHLVRYRAAPWAERIREHVREHLGERLDIGALAAVAGMSASQVSHRFRHETGVPVSQFIRDERIRRAREMLTAGRSVKDVAYSLGFCDEFHFSRVFKRLCGMSPATWRAGNLPAD